MPSNWAPKWVTSFSKKKLQENLVYYVPASLSIKKSSLVHALSKRVNKKSSTDDLKLPLKHDFIAFSGVLENYMLLHDHKQAKALVNIYNNIDPDKFHQNIDEKTDAEFSRMMEKSFLSYFSYCLCQAGYTEVSQSAVDDILAAHFKYGDIELQVDAKDYAFMRFWIYGLTEIYYHNELWHPSRRRMDSTTTDDHVEYERKFQLTQKNKRLAHKHVIVASRKKTSDGMCLKGFKDIPLGYFETLLPEAKIFVPRHRRYILNTFLTLTAATTFFNFGMTILNDYKVSGVWAIVLVMGIVSLRTSFMYRNQRNKYMLMHKQMMYYKSTANNRGLVMDIITRAHERNFKKALIVYALALQIAENNAGIVTELDMQREVTSYITEMASNRPYRKEVCFVLGPTVDFLQRTGLLTLTGDHVNARTHTFRVRPPEEAMQLLIMKLQLQAIS